MLNMLIQFIPMNSILGLNLVAHAILMTLKLLTLEDSHQDSGSSENTWFQWSTNKQNQQIKSQEESAIFHSLIGNVSLLQSLVEQLI